MLASARPAKPCPAASAPADPLITWTPMRKACSRCWRRTVSMADSKSVALATAACRALRSSCGSMSPKKAGSSRVSRAAGRRARVSARRGAKAITSTIKAKIAGWARKRDWSWTPLDRREKNAPKRVKATSGAPVAWVASSRRGARRVKSSRPRSERVAAMCPWCQARIVPDTWAGLEKPIRARVRRVSGSSSTPVKIRLPKRDDRGSSPGKSSP